MSTTRAFEIPSSVKAASVKARFRAATEQPKGASTPSVKDDLLQRIGTDRKHDISDGLPITIDVFPDFRWILMSLMYYANVYYSTIDIKNRSKTSPATITVYFLTILYAHLLVSDLFLRNTPSYWASQFMNESFRRDYLEFLLGLPVPEILMKFIETLTTTNDPRRPHVQYCPSAAGFGYYHDFGRYFPVSIFVHAHNSAATVKASASLDESLQAFYRIKVTSNMSIGNFFGQLMESNNLDSKLNQSFLALFNPIIERSIQRRNTLAPTPISSYEFNSTADFNPYVHLLHCTDIDTSEMQTICESVSVALSTILPMKGQLGTLYDSLNGLDIQRHAYSSYALPTWHATSISAQVTKTSPTHQNVKERAVSLKFLQTFTPANSTTLKYPTDASTIDTLLYLVKKVTKTDNFPDPSTDHRKFHPIYDVSPRLRVLDPYDTNVSGLSSVIYCGLIIESLELDGSIVIQPDTDSSLDEENSQVLQSAVPLQAILRSTSFLGTTHTTAVHAVQRTITTSHSQKASAILYDAGESRLGVFDTSVDEPVPASLPSFRIRENTSWFTRMYNHINYKTSAPGESTDDTGTRVPNGTIVAWSPYRYVSRTWTAKDQSSHVYMLLNLRTIFGMNIPLSEIAHPNTVIPIN
uniref:Capsid protein n=1 Tax=Caloscypha fulgens partitivirus 9 TaxID=2778767 RepID=A0A7L8Y970_9VIRU|nr:capsid protein [Caloscypha fulgens partitivirus 9]